MSWVTKKMIEEWEQEWQDMPEFSQDDLEPFKTIKVNFKTPEDMEKFSKLIGQKITPKTRGVWYPFPEKENKGIPKVYIDES